MPVSQPFQKMAVFLKLYLSSPATSEFKFPVSDRRSSVPWKTRISPSRSCFRLAVRFDMAVRFDPFSKNSFKLVGSGSKYCIQYKYYFGTLLISL
jgi:hypothetical protein